MIPTIHLPRKNVKHFKLEDGTELFMSLDARSIAHFQTANKMGFLKVLNALHSIKTSESLPIFEIMKLLGSCVKYSTGQPVGWKFFKDYDEFFIVQTLLPMLFELWGENLPKAKDESEKK